MLKYLVLDVVKIRKVSKLKLGNRDELTRLLDSILLSKVSIKLETILSLIGYYAYKTYQTDGRWLQTKIDFISEKFNVKMK